MFWFHLLPVTDNLKQTPLLECFISVIGIMHFCDSGGDYMRSEIYDVTLLLVDSLFCLFSSG